MSLEISSYDLYFLIFNNQFYNSVYNCILFNLMMTHQNSIYLKYTKIWSNPELLNLPQTQVEGLSSIPQILGPFCAPDIGVDVNCHGAGE